MNCPGCGYANEDDAKACNLCGKLMIANVAPAPAPEVEDRVPSWPNRAVLCLLSAPALKLIVLPFLLSRDDDGMGPPEGPGPGYLGMALTGGGWLLATLPLAARLRVGPLAASVIGGLVLLGGIAFQSGPGSPMSWIPLGGLALAWVGR